MLPVDTQYFHVDILVTAGSEVQVAEESFMISLEIKIFSSKEGWLEPSGTQALIIFEFPTQIWYIWYIVITQYYEVMLQHNFTNTLEMGSQVFHTCVGRHISATDSEEKFTQVYRDS
ncbi:hypothetical protein JTB14_006391 [Gonioctena quinquepunctata]|nr:hypothetical protein JTB14_006391 [Gonioctena quinquepunctata]